MVSSTSAGWLLVPNGIIHPVINTSTLTLIVMYIYYWNLQFLNNVNINKTKVLLLIGDLIWFWLSCLGLLIFLLPIFKLFGFSIFRFWQYLMKVILSVPDEGYFERTWWRLFWAYLMKVILSVPDKGYFERTWWRLFWAYLMEVVRCVVCTKFDIYVFIT